MTICHSQPAMTSVEDDDDVVAVPSDMFFDSCYVHHDFEFGDVRQGVDALKAASTDIDLTGQIVWPGATFLAWCVAGASVATAEAVDGMGSLPLQLSGLSSRTERPHPAPPLVGRTASCSFCMPMSAAWACALAPMAWLGLLLVCARYLVGIRSKLAGQRILEVGAGTGLCGLLCSQFASEVHTDVL